MPSLLHEVFVDLLRRAPSLAADLLRDVLHVAVPAYDNVEIASEDLSELLPAERRVDSVLVFHKEKRPALVLALEVQLTRDPEKRYSWPMYATALRARNRVPTVLLVYAKSNTLAKWCGKSIDLGQPGSAFQPLVLGPSAIPTLPSLEAALKHPHLAALSAIAHLDEPDAPEQVARALLAKDEAPDLLERFEYEARAQHLLSKDNENVVRVSDLENLDDNTPYFLMEYLRGRTLGAELRERTTLPINERVQPSPDTMMCQFLASEDYTSFVEPARMSSD